MSTARELNPEELVTALRRIAAWRADPDAAVACPRCGWEGLLVIDRSARPHAEWYALACAGCGLDVTISIPLGSPVPGAMD